MPKKWTFLLLALLFGTRSFAQDYRAWNARIDSFINKALPKSALAVVDTLDQHARQDKNAAQQIKAAIYRMNLQSYIEENALVAIIGRLKKDIVQAEYPVKPVLQSLLASVYWNYYTTNRYQFSQRTRLEQPSDDITRWDLQTIVNETLILFRLSLVDSRTEQNTPITVLSGVLTGDTANRSLRPTLYDVLAHRALDLLLTDEPALTKPRNPFSLTDERLFSDGATFSSLPFTSADTTSVTGYAIHNLQQLTRFQLEQKNMQALADIDLRRLQFLYRKASILTRDSLYFTALERIAISPASGNIAADARVLQGQYYQQKNDLKMAFDYFQRAIDDYPGSLGAKNAEGLQQLLLQKDLSATVEDVNAPGKPLLSLLSYRNVATAHFAIYRVSSGQLDELVRLSKNEQQYYSGRILPSNEVLAYLKPLRPTQEENIQLPDPGDYTSHSVEYKIDALDPGIYLLLIRDGGANGPQAEIANFTVSKLSFVTRTVANGKIEVKVMDRVTGKPLRGVKVKFSWGEDKRTDRNGSCISEYSLTSSYWFKMIAGRDTLAPSTRSGSNLRSAFFGNTAVIFTDREIYRPGQSVYFKGLVIHRENGINTVVENQQLTVNVPNYKSFIPIPVTTNEFGTFSGSFVLPEQGLNGNITIRTESGSKSIRVEEYKRPGFEVEFLPVTGAVKPNDSVVVKGRVSAYSGYGLSQATAAVHITRSASPETGYPYSRYPSIYTSQNVEIATDTVKTNDLGEFEIKFKAITDNDPALKGRMHYAFSVNADVTDGSGETRSANTVVKVGQQSVQLAADLPTRLWVEDSLKAAVRMSNLNDALVKGIVQIKIYSLEAPQRTFTERLWDKPDQYLLTKTEFDNAFPQYAYRREDEPEKWLLGKEISHFSLAADGKTPAIFSLDILKNQPSGLYRIFITGRDEQGDTATTLMRQISFVNEPAKLPILYNNWIIPLRTKVAHGESIKILLGTDIRCNVFVEKFIGEQLKKSEWLTTEAGNQRILEWTADTAEKNVSYRFLMVYNNRRYSSSVPISYTPNPNLLNVRFITYRNKLLPGEKEVWKLQITGNNKEAVPAEMVANLYDASLEALSRRDNWQTKADIGRFASPLLAWDYGEFVSNVSTSPARYISRIYFSPQNRLYEQLNLFGYAYYGGFNVGYQRYSSLGQNILYKTDAVEYRASDYQVRNSKSEELLKRMDSFEGDLYELSAVRIDQALQGRLPGVDIAINEPVGNAPLDKVLLAGPIIPRKNFNETAFFYPGLRTNEKGEIGIEFTIPEAVTRWRFRGFVHTRDLKIGYIESEVVTRKQLSISANMPRFLREGDTLTVAARLANLSATALKGTATLQFFNALTDQPVTLFTRPADGQQPFDLAAGINKPVAFRLVIPAGLDAVTYRLTADAGQFTDGEENTLIVVPNRTLVTESVPVMVRAGESKSVVLDKLLHPGSTTLKSKALVFEYTQHPVWYAVQALPYLMEKPFECAEQVFNRYYANSLATSIVNRIPVIKQVVNQWKSLNSSQLLSNLEKNQELKAALLEETPWLREAMSETERKKRIALLFDLNKMSDERVLNLTKLAAFQLPGGGFTWVGGDRPDRYITQYILSGIGQLNALGITQANDPQLKTMTDRSINFTWQALADDERQRKELKIDVRILNPIEIHSYFALSYFKEKTPSPAQQALLTEYLTLAAAQWKYQAIYEQAMIALTLYRSRNTIAAQQIVASLRETAQRGSAQGMYWPDNVAGYYWYEAPIETQSLMIELFSEVSATTAEIEDLKIALLRDKQTHDWKTPKATAAACYALLMKGENWVEDSSATPLMTFGGQPLTDLRPGIKADAGTGYIKTSWTDGEITPELARVSITNTGKSTSWGALYWQYVENLDKITPSTTDIHLERKYFIQSVTARGPVLTAVDATHLPQKGDLLKVVVYVKAGRDFEYVQLKDLRPAGTEPVDVLSAYKYQDGLFYYQVTKDLATNFFISKLNKGSYVFEYQLRVAQSGNFSTGITSVQCMYAPEFNAHSDGGRISFK